MKRKKERRQSAAVRDGDVWSFGEESRGRNGRMGSKNRLKKEKENKKTRGEREKSVGVKAGGRKEEKDRTPSNRDEKW